MVEKKKNGIYFTSQELIGKMIMMLGKRRFKRILEPCYGSGEFIRVLNKKYKNSEIVGIEMNETMTELCENHNEINTENVVLMKLDFLKSKIGLRYNLIIGNPPYYVTNKGAVEEEYLKYIEGRPNIFVLFILKSLNLLKKGGILSFVLPSSFKNCLYYNKLRELIDKTCEIIGIEDCEGVKWLETTQETIIFCVKKKVGNNGEWVIKKSGYTIFNTKEKVKRIKELYEGSKSLNDMNFKVHVGNIVWNQCKDILSEDENETRLIYSSDIKDKKLIKKDYKNVEKKNYIKRTGSQEMILVMNRGYGVGRYNFDYCLIDIARDYLIENHLICIRYKQCLEVDKKKELYEKICSSFDDERTKEFIRLYFGNGAVNTTELREIIPMYQDH
jgi:adenine-specific DNA-methyltransferase